jgi:hypothetical protein
MNWVAERDIALVYPDGRLRTVRLQIGRPYPHPDGDWACSVATEGLHDRLLQVCGIDAWQALMLAIRALEAILAAEVKSGAILHDSTGEESVSLPSVFSREWEI